MIAAKQIGSSHPSVPTTRSDKNTFDRGMEKTKGWISRATYDSLPELFKESARDLVRLGRLEIEGVPV